VRCVKLIPVFEISSMLFVCVCVCVCVQVCKFVVLDDSNSNARFLQ
jgi:hypothetical protein